MATLFLLLLLLVTGATPTSGAASWIPQDSDPLSAGCEARLQARPGIYHPATTGAAPSFLCEVGHGKLIGRGWMYERARGFCRIPLAGEGHSRSGAGPMRAGTLEPLESASVGGCAHRPPRFGR